MHAAEALYINSEILGLVQKADQTRVSPESPEKKEQSARKAKDKEAEKPKEKEEEEEKKKEEKKKGPVSKKD